MTIPIVRILRNVGVLLVAIPISLPLIGGPWLPWLISIGAICLIFAAGIHFQENDSGGD